MVVIEQRFEKIVFKKKKQNEEKTIVQLRNTGSCTMPKLVDILWPHFVHYLISHLLKSTCNLQVSQPLKFHWTLKRK